MKLPLAHGVFLLLFGALLGGCGVIVDPQGLVIKCQTQGSVDPCGEAGMRCVAGECQTCARGAREICGDHRDNDCDGKIDEAAECAPTQSCVQAGCSTGSVCNTRSGECVSAADGGVQGDSATPTGTPDAATNGCSSDVECEAGFCLKPGGFGLQVALSGNRCSTACCADGDCASGSLCVAGTSGVRVCVPVNAESGQPKKTGAACARGTECASGLCSRNTCHARCVTENACGNETCVLSGTLTGSSQSFVCGTAAGRAAGGEPCTAFDPTACKSGWCLGAVGTCAKPCGTSADCGGSNVCALSTLPALVADSTPSLAGICQPEGSAGDKLCCTSAQCGSGQVCKPKSSGGTAGTSGTVSMVCQAP